MCNKIIVMIIQFLEDTFKNMRCYLRSCDYNECSCSNVEPHAEGHHHETVEHDHPDPPEPPKPTKPPAPPTEPPPPPTEPPPPPTKTQTA